MSKKSSGQKGFAVSGRMFVGRFEKEFENEFGVKCQVKKGKYFADNKTSLASLRPKYFSGPKTVQLKIRGNMLISNVKEKFEESFGLQLELYHGRWIAPDDVTLAALRDKKVDFKLERKEPVEETVEEIQEEETDILPRWDRADYIKDESFYMCSNADCGSAWDTKEEMFNREKD